MSDLDKPDTTTDLTALTADLVSAFVSHNKVGTAELPGLIATVHGALAGLGAAADTETVEAFHPAVTARKSLADPDHIVSMIDGKSYSSLKRHLTAHGLTPDEYRARYGLPSSYPMVAPGYSARRSELAKTIGLGRKPKGEIPVAASAAKPAKSGKPARKPRTPKAAPAA
ncbi:MAG: transcriptional regulator [Sphingomonas sp.]|nr:MAG: transcriptional regulator [Sphingomonas sp.]